MFLKQQQIKDNAINESSRSTWEGFREQIGNLILHVNKDHTFKGRALLLGVGNGNDVPIKLIEDIFDEIVIVDIDSEAMIRFMTRVSDPTKFTCIEADLSGVGHLIPDLKYKSERHVIELLSTLEYESFWTDSIKGKFDFIFTFHFTTQLIAPAFMLRFNYITSFPSKKYIQKISECSDRLISGLFEQIHILLDDKGIFFHSTDTFELSMDPKTNTPRPGTFEIIKAIKGDWSKLNQHFNLFTKLMKKGYHITGSELPRNINSLFNNNPRMFVNPWKFNDEENALKTYIVYTYAFKKFSEDDLNI